MTIALHRKTKGGLGAISVAVVAYHMWDARRAAVVISKCMRLVLTVQVKDKAAHFGLTNLSHVMGVIMILATVVLGGMGNIWGVILGAVLLGYIPEKLRFLSDYRIIFFGLLMVVMMNLRPNGLLPRKKREKFQEKSA